MRNSLTGLSRTKLRLWLALFFVALTTPTAILIYQAYGQLKWEAFHQHQVLAEELSARIDGRLMQLINGEEARTFADYGFLVVAGDPSANFVQRSPLSAYPVNGDIPGLVGYFQIDTHGGFSTPLLPQSGVDPTDFGISPTESNQRTALAEHIQRILGDNRLVQGGAASGKGRSTALDGMYRPTKPYGVRQADPLQDLDELGASDDGNMRPMGSESLFMADAMESPAEQQVPAQAAFDRLNAPAVGREPKRNKMLQGKIGRVEDLKLDYSYQAAPGEELRSQIQTPKVTTADKLVRKERSILPQPQSPVKAKQQESEVDSRRPQLAVSIFESEIDPFEFSLLDSGHFVLFRRVWRNGQRYIQGALIEQEPFLSSVFQKAFRTTALSRMSDLIVAFQGDVVSVFSGQTSRAYLASAEDLSGALLYQARLSNPTSDLQLIFSVTRLPSGPGGTLIAWVAVILVMVLCGGFYLMYRLGAGQIDLAHQQQDFVSAVSHELKTPLTSIRMYGEMLREGWVTEDKKKAYYDFIHDESERLSRLIANILQLARLTRNELQVKPGAIAVTELMDGIRSKVSSQIDRTGFTMNLECDSQAAQAVINVDEDAFAQIVINLVDNALKFSAKAENKVIDISCHLEPGGRVSFGVRDYGPGVPRDQMKKIFKLFFRSENELTRETVGTGIGLALVNQLAQAMSGQVDVINREPGAQFRISFAAVR